MLDGFKAHLRKTLTHSRLLQLDWSEEMGSMTEEEIGKLNLKSGKELLRTKKDQVQQAKVLSKEEAKIRKERAREEVKAAKKAWEAARDRAKEEERYQKHLEQKQAEDAYVAQRDALSAQKKVTKVH